MSVERTLQKGPGIHANFYCQDGLLVKVELALSERGLNWTLLGDNALMEPIAEWMHGYAERRPVPISFPLCLKMPPFQLQVMQAMQNIPFGEKISYRELATRAGSERAYRAAGSACAKNPYALIYPCHRVISSQGDLRGFAYGLEIKRRLLDFETP